MRYVVCNLLDPGVRSVGTRSLDSADTVRTIVDRTGVSRSVAKATVARLHPMMTRAVEIPADPDAPEGATAVRVEVI